MIPAGSSHASAPPSRAYLSRKSTYLPVRFSGTSPSWPGSITSLDPCKKSALTARLSSLQSQRHDSRSPPSSQRRHPRCCGGYVGLPPTRKEGWPGFGYWLEWINCSILVHERSSH